MYTVVRSLRKRLANEGSANMALSIVPSKPGTPSVPPPEVVRQHFCAVLIAPPVVRLMYGPSGELDRSVQGAHPFPLLLDVVESEPAVAQAATKSETVFANDVVLQAASRHGEIHSVLTAGALCVSPVQLLVEHLVLRPGRMAKVSVDGPLQLVERVPHIVPEWCVCQNRWTAHNWSENESLPQHSCDEEPAAKTTKHSHAVGEDEEPTV